MLGSVVDVQADARLKFIHIPKRQMLRLGNPAMPSALRIGATLVPVLALEQDTLLDREHRSFRSGGRIHRCENLLDLPPDFLVRLAQDDGN